MKVRIHRGTQQIGGTCIELASGNERIVLDFGLPLDGDADDATIVPQITGNDLKAVLISHPHIDHYGLLHHLPNDTEIIMGSAARRIVRAAAPFTGQAIPRLEGRDIEDGKPIQIGTFRVTPYLVDHSAYDAYAFLIEADGKRLFYSGDFRAHGRKSKLYERIVTNPPKDIDVLFMEGSSLSRLETDESFPTESDLEDEICKHLKATQGLAMFHTSAQNIDRVVTLYRACKKANRHLIIDFYAATILAATRNKNIPQSNWPDVHLFVPQPQRLMIKQKSWFVELNGHSTHRIYAEQLREMASQAVILFRPLMQRDLDAADCLDNASYIYSQWDGYLEKGSYASTEQWLAAKGITMKHIHTSGHASPRDLKHFAEAFAPRALVPIHSFATDKYGELFNNVVYRHDGEWWEV